MKHTLRLFVLSFCFTLCSVNLYSQWVSIPDANFGTWLNTHGYSQCLQGNGTNGWQMDTTCPAVVGATTIICNNLGLTSVEGIQYFDSLEILRCNNNQLTSLPPLPSTLNILHCYNNLIDSLPQLPDSLLSLNCRQNSLVALPALPNTLLSLTCGNNQITTLPSLSGSITIIDCRFNSLITLPQLPDSIAQLYCPNNLLVSLPTLPNTLQAIDCGSNQLTALPALPLDLITLNCEKNALGSLPQLPNSLSTLRCSNNNLTSLPVLPSTLQELYCDDNQITSIPALPSLLRELSCSSNQLSSLPTLPDSLINLFCQKNQITSLTALPNMLTTLYCDSNQLTILPALPLSLRMLHCEHNQIYALPNLPSNMFSLRCDYNQLTFLPTIPDSLKVLSCSWNQLNVIPSLPNVLEQLFCNNNQLTLLPALPASLIALNCSVNQLTDLPPLPSYLYMLSCSINPNLRCLPHLKSIVNLTFIATGITCLPNYPQSNITSNPPLSSIPLCDVFNTNGCPVYWNISGAAYHDADSNCVSGAVEDKLNNLKVYLYQGGVQQQQVYTVGNGTYSFNTNSFATYTYSLDTTNIPFELTCPDTGYYTSVISAADSMDFSKDFGLECKPGFDIKAQSITTPTVFRPANNTLVNIAAGDASNFYNAHCAAGVSGSVVLTYSGPVQLVSAAPNALTPTVSPNTLTWTIADFGNVNFFTDFNILMHTDTNAQIGQQVCFTLTVNPVAGDNNPANNTLTICFPIVNSFDPNDKTVYPFSAVDTANGELTYTIRFQNTGNAEAQHIYITDTLDNGIDPGSFQLLAYSHQPMVIIDGNAVRFNFPNINLPDSNTNEPASHGYVQYKVKLKDNLPVGTAINNTAYIYFDFNAPVVTNTVSNTLCAQTTTHLSETICTGGSTVFFGQLLDSAGVYEHTLQNVCDSVIRLSLAVIPAYTGYTHTMCSGETYPFNGLLLQQAGVYYDTLQNSLNCDSIVELTLVVNSSSAYSYSHTMCSGETYSFNGQLLQQAGVYYDTLQNSLSCDSVVELTLVTNSSDKTFTISNDTLIANAVCDVYEWWNCGLNSIVGNGNRYMVTSTGNYALETVTAGCSSGLSNCEYVQVLGINELAELPFTIYPNPSNGSVTISVGEKLVGSTVTISDVTGRVVFKSEIVHPKSEINLAGLGGGIYFVTVGSSTQKLVKE